MKKKEIVELIETKMAFYSSWVSDDMDNLNFEDANRHMSAYVALDNLLKEITR
jgi:hypothetical protein